MDRIFKVLAWLLRAVLWTATVGVAAVLVALAAFERELPSWLSQPLADVLCQGPVCVQFDQSAFSLRHGLRLRGVRLYCKGALGPPWLTVQELRVGGAYQHRRPVGEWVDSVHARGATLAALPAPALFSDWLDRVAGERITLPGVLPKARSAVESQGWMRYPVHVVFEDLDLLGFRVVHLETDLQQAADELELRQVRLRWEGASWTEQAEGQLRIVPITGRFRLQLEGQATPAPLLPLFRALGAHGVVDVCQRFEAFHEPLAVRCELGRERRQAPLSASIRLRATTFRYRGVPMERGQAEIRLAENGVADHVRVDPLMMEGAEGSLAGGLSLDPARRVMDLHLKSQLPAPALVAVLGLSSGTSTGVLKHVAFAGTPDVAFSGQVARTRSLLPTRIEGRLSSAAVRVFGVLMEDFATAFRVDGTDYALEELHGRCLGGSVTGRVAFAHDAAASTWSYRGQAGLDDVRFGDLCQSLGHTNTYGGQVSGRLELEGPLGEPGPAWPTGGGQLAVKNGSISRVPLFAGFTDYLARHVPGVETLVSQSAARLTFACSNGVFHTDSLVVEGGFFGLRAAGSRQAGGQLDFHVQARLFKEKTLVGRVARVVTFPFSKMLEFRVTGFPRAPKWNYIGLLDRLWDLTGLSDDGDDGAAAEEAGAADAPPTGSDTP